MAVQARGHAGDIVLPRPNNIRFSTPPNIIIELTGRSAFHRPVSVFPGQHIVGRLRYCGALASLSGADQPISASAH